MRGLLACGLLASIAFVSTQAAVQVSRNGRKAQKLAGQYDQKIKPLLNQYCYSCHGAEKQKADLSLEKYGDVAAVKADRKLWEEVLRKLRHREMPPEGKPQPSDAERERLVSWIEAELFPVDCDHPDPGRVTIRRLNRVEYRNTIRDLVGVTVPVADDFPADDTGYGFDNIGDVLSLSPLLLEKYLAAAEKIVDAAILDPESQSPPARVYEPKAFKVEGGGSLADSGTFSLYSQGEAYVTHTVTNAGEYRIRVLGYGQQAGPEPVKMALRLDKQDAQIFEVTETESAPGWKEARVELEQGRHRIGAAFLNDYYKQDDPNPANRDRNLLLERFEIVGPLNAPAPPVPESQRRILFAQPAPGTTNECARRVLAEFARKAFRRPVSSDEVTRLTEIFRTALEDGVSFERSIKIALQAVLVSPHFLFRGELQPDPNNPRKATPVDEFALASRLSYFLWSSMPDEELFGLAAKGKLRKNLDAQVRRMISDPKSQALVENFAGQWLQTRMLKEAAPDPGTFPSFDDGLRAAMVKETELLFAHIFREDRSILEFLNADYTFVNERLARHYGLAGVSGTEFRRVSLKGTPRGGVLTHGSVLTLTSNPTRTSPVKRGKWVLENLLAQAPPPPPPGVPPLNETKEAAEGASLRQRMELHRQDPMCSSCHSIMDPIGFGLENFDGIGAWRDREGPFPVDASGTLNTGEPFSGAAELRGILTTRRRDQFVRCLVEKMLTYALGRGLEYYDRCAVDRIAADLAHGGYRFSILVNGVIRSVPFQMRRGEGDLFANGTGS